MKSRAIGVSIALVASLTAAPLCFAQEPPIPAAPVIKADTAATAAKTTPMQLTKRASFGGSLGWSMFLADADYTKVRDANGEFGNSDTRSRPAFQATFRYQVTPWLRWQVSPGYTWVGYKKESPIPFPDANYPDDATKEKLLTQLLPISAQLQWTFSGARGWNYHVGGGPGVYRVWVQNRRKVLQDPVTRFRHVGWYPGFSAEIGASRFLKSLTSVSVEGAIDGHAAFATRAEQFPSGFNASVWAIEARFGVNYHFDPRRFGGKSPTKAPAPSGR